MCIICRNKLYPERVSLEQEVLIIDGCEEIKEISGLKNISKLVIKNCPNLEKIWDIIIIGDINYCDINKCNKLRKIGAIKGANSIKINDCINLETINNFNDVININISGCSNLKEIEYLIGNSENRDGEFYIKNCNSLNKISFISNFTLLNIEECKNLGVIDYINNIYIIEINNCININKIVHLECIDQIYIIGGILDKLEEMSDLSNMKLFIDNYINLCNITKITKFNDIGIFITKDNYKDSINCCKKLLNFDCLEKIRNFIILKDYYYENEGDEEIKIIDNYKIQYNNELLQNELNNKELLI
jgi:hypothetical protein